jgi:3-hydroxybutyryl-CoA dehydrogenase/5-formyl-3-hydroxy-2-methylpyridine 4-carboxylate dehydrogenase
LSDSKGVSSTIGDKVEAGTLGIKTGGGLFEYQPGEIPGLMQRRVKLLMEVKKALSQSAT